MAITISGSGIVEANIADGEITSDKLATGIDAIKLADGTVTSVELQYINSLSSNAQTQIDGVGGKVVAVSQSFLQSELTGTSVSTYHHNFEATITPQSVSNKVLIIMSIGGVQTTGAGRLQAGMH